MFLPHPKVIYLLPHHEEIFLAYYFSPFAESSKILLLKASLILHSARLLNLGNFSQNNLNKLFTQYSHPPSAVSNIFNTTSASSFLMSNLQSHFLPIFSSQNLLLFSDFYCFYCFIRLPAIQIGSPPPSSPARGLFKEISQLLQSHVFPRCDCANRTSHDLGRLLIRKPLVNF